MTDQATRIVPAGWYEDPASRAHVRWWNGLAWTEHTALKPTEQPRPQPVAPQYQQPAHQPYQEQGYAQQAAALQAAQQQAAQLAAQQAVEQAQGVSAQVSAETAARIAEARALERQYGISTEEHDIIVSRAAAATGEGALIATDSAGTTSGYDASAYGTTNYRAWNEEEEQYEEPGTTTASSWFIALWPVLTLVAIAAAGYVAFFITPEPAVAGIPVVAGVVLVPLLLTFLWAGTDARKLRSLGHAPASAGFSLLGPLIYLIARRTKVKGVGPLVTLIVLSLIAIGGPAAAVLTGAADPMTKALEIQQTIRTDLVGSGQLASVTCPIFVESVAQGALYTCDGTTIDGADRLIWVSIDSADGAFSYAPAVAKR